MKYYTKLRVKCVQCGASFLERNIGKSQFCCVECWRSFQKANKNKGSLCGRGALTRIRKKKERGFKYKELKGTEEESNNSMGWHGIYNKKQYEKMVQEKGILNKENEHNK